MKGTVQSIVFLLAILGAVMAAPIEDLVLAVPGFTGSFNSRLYSGYLKTDNANRELHYIFIQSVKGVSNNDPVTLWLNGGPGCSSLLGFIQQVGPFYLQDGADYKKGDQLIENPYSWHKASNLLFIQSPAGVGFSYNLDKSYKHNDNNTAYDMLASLKDFYAKFPQYKTSRFYISGQSYAGKYIPDLAVLIDKYNIQASSAAKINLISIFVGNGVMTFKNLQQSTYEFMIGKSFVSPSLASIYQKACKQRPQSDECDYFKIQYARETEDIDPYNVYGYCFYKRVAMGQEQEFLTQESILEKLKMDFDPTYKAPAYNGAPCAYFAGISSYFDSNEEEYHAKFRSQKWQGPCASISYAADPAGSIQSYKYLIDKKRISIILYNGNWDAVVPFVDTLKGIKLLGLSPIAPRVPWFTDQQHSGFSQSYDGLTFVTVKGASHQVPQARRAESLNLLRQVLNGRGEIFAQNPLNTNNIRTE